MATRWPATSIGFALIFLSVVTARAEPAARTLDHVGSLAVIVHPDRLDQLKRNDLIQIYLKKRRYWRDGTSILPINLEADSRLREQFRQSIFGRRARNLVAYWNREYFRGVLPPATLASPEAVLRFVSAERNAIGYVPVTIVDERVRQVLTIEPQSASP